MGTKRVIRSVLDGVDYFCRKTDNKTLKKLALSIGSQAGTTKTALRSNIVAQCELLKKLSDTKKSMGKLDITAIDMGLENFAYSRLSWHADQKIPELREWNKMRISSPNADSDDIKTPFTPKMFTQVGQTLTDTLTAKSPDLFVVERQRTRTLGSAAVPDPILKVNALEHVLFMSLNAKKFYVKNLHYLVESSDPRRMTDFWCQAIPIRKLLESAYGLDSPKAHLKATSSTLTKMLKIALVKSMLLRQAQEKFTLSPLLSSQFTNYTPRKKYDLFEALQLGDSAGTSKEDDLADSLLHGLAWVEWLRNFDELAAVISGEEADQAGLKAFNDFNKSKWTEREHYSKTCILEL
ncbi:LAME_0E00782g1_1 [Lachancea meyersii CBS 8951]|uniref:LAME_0E00782g1_1 n=1 Tax=Lachancea meyersii CBS 8951 TaxID=1266667 RepID=A0A1G4JEY9_9SACH|nr:LAME_0E00782g1_1 [Lachancea meyersii CBS 8951]